MANNPYINQLIYAGNVLMDLTNDTVDAAHLAKNYTAHDKSGAPITGTMESGGITPSGTLSITSNGTYDVTNYAGASVNVSGGKNLQATIGSSTKVKSTTYKKTDIGIVCNKTGIYTLSFAFNTNGNTSRSYYSVRDSSENELGSGTVSALPNIINITNLSLNEGQNIEFWARSGSSTIYFYFANIILQEE